MTSTKQQLANQANARKSTGPKTAEGKARSSRNALKHGLLAKEIVITQGEGAEDQEAFDRLLEDLISYYQPQGVMEEMLVEKIAGGYWRQMRVHRCEAGAIRNQLDTLTEDYYYPKANKKDAQIDALIAEKQHQIDEWQKGLDMFQEAFDEGEDLARMNDWQDQWIWFYQTMLMAVYPGKLKIDIDNMVQTFIDDCKRESACVSTQILKQLRQMNLNDEYIWRKHLDFARQRIKLFQLEIRKLEKEKAAHRLRIDALKRRKALPDACTLQTLLRYETAIDRQTMNAIGQLERMQKRRGFVPGS